MSRISRVFIDHACYHITTRGNQKQPVFVAEEDFLKYLAIVKKAKKKYAMTLYAYCLMLNHTHMLVRTPHSRDISKFMHWINRGYTAYFNTKYNKVGHLWQGRFNSKPIVTGYYMLHCATYIETNPVRANLVSDIAEYKWSSYKERCLVENSNIINAMKIEYSDEMAGTALI